MSQALQNGAGDPVPVADQATVEAAARAKGWRDAHEFANGAPTNFVDAATFLRNAETDAPLLRKENLKLEPRLNKLLRDQEETKGLVVTMTESLRRAEEKAYTRARRELEAERDKAITNGDVAAVKQVDQEIAGLAAPPPAPKAAAMPVAPQPDPAVAAWVSENEWFKDPVLANEASMQERVLMASHPDMGLEERLQEVTKRVRALYPAKFENSRRRAPGAVSGSSSEPAPQRSNGHTFADLPNDAKQQFHRYKKMLEGKGKPLTEQEWADNYDWD